MYHVVVPSFRTASLGVPGLVETASYDMLDAENDFHDYDLSILEIGCGLILGEMDFVM